MFINDEMVKIIEMSSPQFVVGIYNMAACTVPREGSALVSGQGCPTEKHLTTLWRSIS